MKFKRKLKKLFFYDRSFIKMVCFLIVLLLVLILGSNFGYVSAEEVSDEEEGYNVGTWSGQSVLNYNSWLNSSIYDANYNFNQGLYSDQDMVNFMNAFNSLSIPESYNYEVVGNHGTVSFSDVPEDLKYLVFRNYSDGSSEYLNFSAVFFAESCVYNMEDGGIYGFPTNTNWVFYLNLSYSKAEQTITIQNTSAFLIDSWTQLTYAEYEGTKYYKSPYGGGNVLFGSANIYAPKNGVNTNIAEFMASGLSSDSFYNVNYMLFDGSYDDGSGSGGGSNETTANNLYLSDSKWNFSIPKWANLSSYSGNATFSASLNDFQQENLSDFYLRFTFTIHTSQSYVDTSWGGGGTSGGGHDTSDVLGSGSQYTGYNSYIFKYKDSSTNNEYLDVTLQDFYNMGSSKAFMTLNGIFDRCYKVGFSGNMSDTKFISWYSDAVSSSRYTTTKAILYCYATLYDSSGSSSGNCVYYYDLLNGTSGVTDSSMSVNNNPYVDEEGNVSTTLPGGESTTEDSYSGNGINVTQTVTVNNGSGDSKSWLWTLISSLISSDDETVSEAGMSDTLVNFVGINPWISLMSTTFGFIPATIWTTLSACFIVVMGILVVAFVLRIILDLL